MNKSFFFLLWLILVCFCACLWSLYAYGFKQGLSVSPRIELPCKECMIRSWDTTWHNEASQDRFYSPVPNP